MKLRCSSKLIRTVTAAFAAVILMSYVPAALAAADHASPEHGSSSAAETFDRALHDAEDMSAEVEGAGAHHGADAHGGEAHGSGGLPQFDVTKFPSQLFWLAVTFAIMYLTFSGKTLPGISSVIENRREHIQNDLETAERLRNDAEQVQNAYESGLEAARSESSRLLGDAIEGVKRDSETAQQRLREKGEQDMAALEERLAKSTAAAREDMDMIAAEIAHLAAEKIFGISTDIKKAKTVVQSINAREAA
jgi:F-type H+-transporting ATPase subunit b